MKRKQILDTAAKAVLKDRQSTYGSPENSFKLIAQYWELYLCSRTLPLTPFDVAAMLALLKIARIAKSPGHEDNWTDLAGYAACGGELATEPKQ